MVYVKAARETVLIAMPRVVKNVLLIVRVIAAKLSSVKTMLMRWKHASSVKKNSVTRVVKKTHAVYASKLSVIYIVTNLKIFMHVVPALNNKTTSPKDKKLSQRDKKKVLYIILPS